MNERPRYTQVFTCAHCQFLGHHEGCDLYYCAQPSVGAPTVIARWGNEGNDQIAGMAFAQLGIHPALTEALRRSQERDGC